MCNAIMPLLPCCQSLLPIVRVVSCHGGPPLITRASIFFFTGTPATILRMTGARNDAPPLHSNILIALRSCASPAPQMVLWIDYGAGATPLQLACQSNISVTVTVPRLALRVLSQQRRRLQT